MCNGTGKYYSIDKTNSTSCPWCNGAGKISCREEEYWRLNDVELKIYAIIIKKKSNGINIYILYKCTGHKGIDRNEENEENVYYESNTFNTRDEAIKECEKRNQELQNIKG